MEQKANINGIMSTIIVWALFFTFMILKLCKVIDWSWWWVTAPLWGAALLGVALLLIGAMLVAIYHAKWKRQQREFEKRFKE